MAVSFQNALVGAQKFIRDTTAQKVRYERTDGSLTANIIATPATSEADQQVEENYRVAFVVDEFLVMKADIDGKFGKPQRGDKIIVVVDGIDTDIFEVMPTETLPVFSWADTYHQQYRIHCKQVNS